MAHLTADQIRAVADNLDIAQRAARRMSRMFYWVELDDLMSWAYYGLIVAAVKYKPFWEAPFPAFAFKTTCRVIQNEWRNEHHGRQRQYPFSEDDDGEIYDAAVGFIDWNYERLDNADEARWLVGNLTLSEADVEILQGLAEGEAATDIARRLGISKSSITRARRRAQDQFDYVPIIYRCRNCLKAIPGDRPGRGYCSELCLHRYNRQASAERMKGYPRSVWRASAM